MERGKHRRVGTGKERGRPIEIRGNDLRYLEKMVIDIIKVKRKSIFFIKFQRININFI